MATADKPMPAKSYRKQEGRLIMKLVKIEVWRDFMWEMLEQLEERDRELLTAVRARGNCLRRLNWLHSCLHYGDATPGLATDGPHFDAGVVRRSIYQRLSIDRAVSSF